MDIGLSLLFCIKSKDNLVSPVCFDPAMKNHGIAMAAFSRYADLVAKDCI